MLSAEWWDINHEPARLSCVRRTVKFTEYTLCALCSCTLYRPVVIRTRPRHAKEIAALKFKRFDFSSTFSCFSTCFSFPSFFFSPPRFVGVYFIFGFFFVVVCYSSFPTTPSYSQREADKSFYFFFLPVNLAWTENGSFAFLFTCNIF